MKSLTIAAAALMAVSGFALAAAEDESAFTIDLSGASKDVHSYHLKCQNGRDLTQGCGLVSVWENTNGVRGLQSTVSMTGIKADSRLSP